uniref:D-alanine--D-alanine ligase family protein n=1 Tax=Pseudomonas sp. TaxID=306 RepID=UPI002586DED9
ERDVSLKSGRRVADALADSGCEVEIREPDSELIGHLIATRPDVVWSTLHGAVGEDGSLQDLLSLAQIRFVGTQAEGARLAWNKPTAKILLARHGVQTPASITLPSSSFKELNAESVLAMVATELTYPLIVKPARSGSAQGVNQVNNAKEFSKAMIEAFAYCDEVMVEKFVAGTELAISVVDLGGGPVALPAVEIVPESGSFGYNERYTPGQTDYFVPARLPATTLEAAAELATTAHSALRLRHRYRGQAPSHIEIFVGLRSVVSGRNPFAFGGIENYSLPSHIGLHQDWELRKVAINWLTRSAASNCTICPCPGRIST